MESIRCSKISNKNMVKNNTYPTHLSFDSAALHQSPNTMTAINKTWLPIRSTITTPPKQNSSMPPCKKSWNKLRFFPCFFHVFASFNFGRGSLGFRFKSFLKNTHTHKIDQLHCCCDTDFPLQLPSFQDGLQCWDRRHGSHACVALASSQPAKRAIGNDEAKGPSDSVDCGCPHGASNVKRFFLTDETWWLEIDVIYVMKNTKL